MPVDQFQTQVNEAYELFQRSTSTLFARLLQLFRATVAGNAFISVGGNNWMMTIGRNESYAPLLNIPMTYENGNCSCATSSSCFESAAFYDSNKNKVYTTN
ncbi:unnamed protein product, partial [Rotaria sp. Silwood2]